MSRRQRSNSRPTTTATPSSAAGWGIRRARLITMAVVLGFWVAFLLVLAVAS